MSHRASPRFWRKFDELPPDVQQIARQNYKLLQSNPQHPSLRFKRVGRYWSVRVGKAHRALGFDVPTGILWFWTGTHEEYKKIVRHSAGG